MFKLTEDNTCLLDDDEEIVYIVEEISEEVYVIEEEEPISLEVMEEDIVYGVLLDIEASYNIVLKCEGTTIKVGPGEGFHDSDIYKIRWNAWLDPKHKSKHFSKKK